MAKLVVDDLDDDLMVRLERHAAARAESVASVVKDIIARNVSPSRADIVAAFKLARSLTPPGPQTDSVVMVRELRDE